MKNILIIYGSTTGNSENIAYLVQVILKDRFKVSVKNCIDLPNGFLFTEDIDIYILCTSTWGIDPASLQEDFEIFWHHANKTTLANKKFILLGLGDKYYPFFAIAVDILKASILEHKGIIVDNPLKIDDSIENKESLLNIYLEKILANL
ncbi:MAG: flavodoxin-like domain-containing protein [Alphaproteobacteria bacterium]|jgi:flavodoxin|nr:flavodoxin-like domain-containing protein [Alphaproteobacteria bacterium]